MEETLPAKEDSEQAAFEEEKEPVYFNDLPKDTEVIGVRFRSSGKVYYFDPQGVSYPEGAHAVVETARGVEYGTVAQSNRVVPGREIVLPLRCALRVATAEDDAHNKENLEKAEEAFLIGNKKIAEHGLDMKLIDTEYTFDNSKLLFYFTSDGRVDFRDLVKDLASVFRCRIELRQMGIRDEAKVLGGLGTCGRPFCCHAFLPDFVQVSIKMAKEQNLSLNSAKISGACGRLMCCLRYEYDTYLEEGRLTPKVDSLVNTPDGIGVVIEAKPLLGLVKVKSLEDGEEMPKVYAREDLTPIKKGDENYERALEEKTLEKAARSAGTTRTALKNGKDKNEKEEKHARPVRPAPQRAASYPGQVMPLALTSAKEASASEENREEEPSKKEASAQNQKRTHGRRPQGGAHKKSWEPRGEKPEKSERPEKAEQGERGEQAERAPRYEKIPRSGQEQKGEKSGRHEKASAAERQNKGYSKPGRTVNQERKGRENGRNGEKPAMEKTPEKSAVQPASEQGAGQKKNNSHRPFRHFNKKKDGGKEQQGK
ncbi:MAG: hypothetical protein IJX08_09730 [Clostridia bacterium]|nr:hypothetical protein [Clostridia bacterium]